MKHQASRVGAVSVDGKLTGISGIPGSKRLILTTLGARMAASRYGAGSM